MRPSFAKLSDFDTEHTRFASKYSVYLYREGWWMRIQRYRIATIGVLILTETPRSKVFLFSLSLGMRAVTSRFDLLLRGCDIFSRCLAA